MYLHVNVGGNFQNVMIVHNTTSSSRKPNVSRIGQLYIGNGKTFVPLFVIVCEFQLILSE